MNLPEAHYINAQGWRELARRQESEAAARLGAEIDPSHEGNGAIDYLVSSETVPAHIKAAALLGIIGHANAALATLGAPLVAAEDVKALSRLQAGAEDPSDWYGATLQEDREAVVAQVDALARRLAGLL